MKKKDKNTEIDGVINITNTTHFCINCNGLNGKHYSDCPLPKVYAIKPDEEVNIKKPSFFSKYIFWNKNKK